jgi:DNA-directed RNA polymerase subunit K/omega
MSYFDDDSDNEYADSMSGGDSSDDDEPLNPPKKNVNKQLGDDDMGDDVDEGVDETYDDGNDTDDLGNMTETDVEDENMSRNEDEDEGEGENENEGEGEDEVKDESKDLKQDKSKKDKKDKKDKKGKKDKKKILDLDEDDDEDYDNEEYLQKFNEGVSQNYVLNNHPECVVHNYNEVLSMCQIVRDANGIVIDDLHRTIPYLTKYERARILGIRAKQINSGATPFIKLSEGIIDGYVIAEMELKNKKIPFIIRRPMPNGGSEYWFLKDLEDLAY